MTTETIPETACRPAQGRSWGQIAVGLAGKLAAEDFPRGDLAELRRMDPDDPDAAAFWRLMAGEDLLGSPTVERKWALALHGLALMTRTAGSDLASRSAHDRHTPIGEALFYGDDRSRTAGFYSHTRLNRLLTARGPMLRTLLARMFRMLAAADQPFNWYRMAPLILAEGHDEEQADNERRGIARAYYQAENYAQRTQSQEANT